MLPSRWVTVKRAQAIGGEVGKGLVVGNTLLAIEGDARKGLVVAEGLFGVVCIESSNGSGLGETIIYFGNKYRGSRVNLGTN